MFNSQQITTDPWPWQAYSNGHRSGRFAEDVGDLIAPRYCVFDPRPSFSNNPNRILVAFRDYCTEASAAELQRAAVRWLEALDDVSVESAAASALDALYEQPARRGYIEATEQHARKVLARLANLTIREVAS